jgi:pilus assembly protein CpaB
MRRGRLFILLAIILLLGAVAAYLILGRGGGEPSEGEAEVQPTAVMEAQIVIAAQDISRGSVIQQDAVFLSPYPADYIVETMETDPTVVVGRYARMDIARGVPITANMITEEAGELLGTGSVASIAIPDGKTAITIPMDKFTGVAYALRPGDKVDVIASMLVVDLDPDFQSLTPNESFNLIDPDGFILTASTCGTFTVEEGIAICGTVEDPPVIGKTVTDEETGQLLYGVPSEDQRPRLVTQRLISNATVLEVGTFPLIDEVEVALAVTEEDPALGAEPPPQVQAQQIEAAQEITFPDVVTLIVDPQDALALSWSANSGVHLVLTLRNPQDSTVEDLTDSVTLQYFFDNYNIAVPAKVPFGLQPKLDTSPFNFPLQEEVEPESPQ